ncbi:diacylglycerol/lipid kinase family protein [Nocardioides sp. B-3]|uniref:diacylglycerol/lipid kinase family protein n=1 Tax=Nocardioides sp. B-3 TaxID=2895565 RepID=UPI0021536198|nr:diacylglycerol kinase family protein [Nocardioides sp. B-3]UUZ61213.1 diacylglycerol kinase family lipid kinase [Nocardioides sp. B-3]
MDSFVFLVNPASGGGAAPEAVVPVARRLRDHGASVEVTYSPGPEACRALVAEAVGRGDVVVSVGGDGMLSSIAGAVSRAGGTLGIVPAGRGNDFARMLGIPKDPLAQADVLLAGNRRTVDMISYGDRLVAGSVYAGVDARAAEIVDSARWVPKIAQYPLAALRALATYTPASYRVTIDGVAHEFNGATVVVANSGYYGKGMKIAPAAVLDDGLLDVIVIEAASRARADALTAEGLRRRARGSRPVHVFTGGSVTIAATSRRPVPVGGDGEALGVLPTDASAPATVSVLPGALTVIA